jgi:hypothetical protein
MSIGSSSWVTIEPQIFDRVLAGIHKHFAETDVTVQVFKDSAPLEALEQVLEASKLWTRSPGSSWAPITTTICMNHKVCNVSLDLILHPCGSYTLPYFLSCLTKEC